MGALPLHFLPSHSSCAGAWPGLCSHGCSWPLVWVMVGRSGRAPLGRVGRGHKSRVSPRGGGRAGGERSWAPAGGSPRPREEGRGGEPCAGGGLHTLTLLSPGEPYITIEAYTALLEDEISLEQGETIEVIHKLLDGWWVIR